jgi:LacI family transcriptional regulator
VKEVSLTRRGLEKRFRKQFNHSILDEIRRVRTNLIAQLLVETNFSILHIALSLGYQGTEHISRYFRKEKGLTLLQYRKKYGKK